MPNVPLVDFAQKIGDRFRSVKARPKPEEKTMVLQRSSNLLVRFAVSGLFFRVVK